MNIEDLTIREARELAQMFSRQETSELPFVVGKPYFIRTIAHHYTGRLEKIIGKFLVLRTAAWIADDGRFSDALASGEFKEIEPYPADQQVFLNTETILDAVEFKHNLPTVQK